MGTIVQRTIVVSAVNVRKGGTLTIQRDCLRYLSMLAKEGEYKVYALVHSKQLYDCEGIEYIEFPNTIKSWFKRLWCEYVTMNRVSKKIGPVYLWLSMHDTTPNVRAERRAVYCQTSFPFYDFSIKDFYFDYKIALFSILTRFVYRINVHKNNYLVVQQEWFRKGLSDLLSINKDKIIVAPPQRKIVKVDYSTIDSKIPMFFYPSTPDCHKNFETLCEAARLLEQKIGKNRFEVVITLSGDKNRYDHWLYRRWGNIDSINFVGFLNKETLYSYYSSTDCLVFPSKVETWGLPISEYMDVSSCPILLADLPYAHETACGNNPVAFFEPTDAEQLALLMEKVIEKDFSDFAPVNKIDKTKPYASDWADLFSILLN